MSLGCGGECASTIAGWRIRRRGHRWMKAQRDHAAACSERSSSNCNRWRRRDRLLSPACKTGGPRRGKRSLRSDRKLRLSYFVGPSHNVWQCDVAFELDIGRSHNCLRSVIRLRRKRNNRLRGKFGVRLGWPRGSRITSIERWKILRWLVINDVSVVERGLGNDFRLEREEPCEANQKRQPKHVTGA